MSLSSSAAAHSPSPTTAASTWPRVVPSSGTAEALADYAHNLARRDLGLADNQGLRFSWGYAACPDLEEQQKVLPLLNAEAAIGLTLSLSNNLDPEHSTAAIVLHHPETKYFAVRSAA